MSSSATPQPRGTAKPPKLRLDMVYGPPPNPDGKYRSASQFSNMYRAYQWTQGFDVTVGFENPAATRLNCNTHPSCPFSITAEYTTFTEPPLVGQPGFRISPAHFVPDHSHPPPYLALDPAAENARRAHLAHDDPSLQHPPLVPVQGFAASSSGAGGGGAGGFAASAASGSGTGAGVGMGPGAKRPRVSGGMGSGGGVTGRASPAAAPAAAAAGTPTPTVASAASTYVQHTPPVAALAGPTTGGGGLAAPPAPAAAAAAPAPAPALTPQQQQQVATPLGRYLCDISPAFIPHLSAFNANGIPLSTQPSDLVDLDSGAADDHEIFNTFRDVRALSPFLVALAADGTRKAKRRQLEGATTDVDPRIAVGLQKLNAERWVRLKIAEGLQVQAQARAQAQAGDGAGQA